MACDCITTINEKLPGDHRIVTTMSTATGRVKPKIATTEGSFVEPTYCPYCGEKYEREGKQSTP